MPEDNRIVFNGIDGITGQYLVAPMEVKELLALVRDEQRKPGMLDMLARVWRNISQPFLGLPLGIDPGNVSQAGWGVVIHSDEDPAVKRALEPLIEHRRRQSSNPDLVHVLEYKPDDTWETWLSRYGSAAGSINPRLVPYYLLLVGSPQQVPFEFGHLLDVEYAVGRLHFDTASEYSAYIEGVIDYETCRSVPNGKEAVFFGTRHPFDRATQMSADYLVEPLASGSQPAAGKPANPGTAERWGYRTRKILGAAASRASLQEAICPAGGTSSPALLFTASHGVGFPRGHALQKTTQGALLCQDWPGFGSIQPTHYFSAADIPAEAQVQGMVMFHFACYGGGTPQVDNYLHQPNQPPPAIADEAFIAALPKAWLTHPRGGSLACIGHVERAWGYSILPPNTGPQIQTFENSIGRILTGQPLGFALKDFNERYAALSTALTARLQRAGWGETPEPDELASSWIERNDAEGYILIGDPAVRLRVDDLA